MEAVEVVRAQAPVLQNWRRNVATTVVFLTLGTLLVCGECRVQLLASCLVSMRAARGQAARSAG